MGQELAAWHAFLRWLAPVAGGLFAYLAVDIRGIAAAIPEAWELAKGLRLTKKQRELARWCVCVWTSVATLIWLIFFSLFSLIHHFEPHSDPTFLYIGPAVFGVVMATMSTTGWVIEIFDSDRSHHQDQIQELREVAFYTFPPILLCYHIPRGLWWLGWRGIPHFAANILPRAVQFCTNFAWHWFKLVHSSLRLLCLVDAALFTAIGLAVGGPIIAWMIAGGLFGVINYRVVSIRLLGLAPASD